MSNQSGEINQPLFNTISTTTTSMSYKAKNKKPPPPWRTSEAKETLRLLLQEDVDNFWHDLDPREIYEMSPMFQEYDENRFLANFRSLKQSIQKEKNAVAFDQAGFLHDRQLFPVKEMSCRGYKRWDGSEAQRLLKKDVIVPSMVGTSVGILKNRRSQTMRLVLYFSLSYQAHTYSMAATVSNGSDILELRINERNSDEGVLTSLSRLDSKIR